MADLAQAQLREIPPLVETEHGLDNAKEVDPGSPKPESDDDFQDDQPPDTPPPKKAKGKGKAPKKPRVSQKLDPAVAKNFDWTSERKLSLIRTTMRIQPFQHRAKSTNRVRAKDQVRTETCNEHRIPLSCLPTKQLWAKVALMMKTHRAEFPGDFENNIPTGA